MQPLKTLRGTVGVALLATFLALSHASATPYGIARISVSNLGTSADADSGHPVISANGRFVAFYSWATNLVPGRTVQAMDCYLRDLSRGTTELISENVPGHEPHHRAAPGAVSADGRFVAFGAVKSDPANGFPIGPSQVFVRDRELKTTEVISVATSGEFADGSCSATAISADGRFVAFSSMATNLVSGDTNNHWDIFVRDRERETTERVSVASSGIQGNGDCFFPSMSADGRYIVFESTSTTLVLGDINGNRDLFVRDRERNTTQLVSLTPAGQQRSDISSPGTISANGRYVAYAAGFYPDGPPPVPSRFPTNYTFEIYVHDLVLRTTERVSVNDAEEAANGPSQSTGGDVPPQISADGRFVAFYSLASNLDANDTNEVPDVFIRDRLWGTTERISLDPSGSQTLHPSSYPALSADGTLVAFESPDNNLVPGDPTLSNDVFVTQRGPGDENLPPIAHAGADQTLSVVHDGAAATTPVSALLSAGGSYDPDGEVVFYEWRSTAGHPLSTEREFAPVLEVGIHHFILSVMDIHGTRTRDDVTVTVLPEPNQAPIANAGTGQQLTVPKDGNPATNTVPATLDGGLSFDPDADTLTYEWRSAAGDIMGRTAGFTTSLTPGKHTFRLRVTDPYGAVDEESVSILVLLENNRSPVARAGADQEVRVPQGASAEAGTAAVQLNGIRSSDPDGDVLTYEWRDATNAIVGASATVNLNLPVGTHTFFLTVTDPYGAEGEDRVQIRVRPVSNRRPVARAGADQAIAEVTNALTPVTLNGSGSTDPEGGALTYAWSLLGNPLAEGTNPTVELEPGRHPIRLTVTDTYGATATDEVMVTVGVVDVTSDVLIRKGRPVAAGRGGKYTVVVRITNRTPNALPAPVSLVLDGLPATVKVTNASGTTTDATGAAGRPYLNAKGSLAPGQTVALTLQLTIRGRATTLPGTQRVLAGLGPR